MTLSRTLPRAVHLAGRFFGSLAPGRLAAEDAAWVAGLLSAGERGLWDRMSTADQKHAAGVARRVAASFGGGGGGTDGGGEGDRPVLVAALLHDVGKVESGLGTLSRAAATAARPVAGVGRLPARWRQYFDHPAVGARLLEAAGSDPLVVTWAREHHTPRDRWTVPVEIGDVLKAADDD